MYLKYIRSNVVGEMPVVEDLEVGDRANNVGTPIILTNDWTKEWGQVVPLHAHNRIFHEIKSLKEVLNGFYVYKISCKCDNVERSGLDSLIKIGRSAAPKKGTKDAKIDGTVAVGGIKARLLSYHKSYAMNDTKLLLLILFEEPNYARKFETKIKHILKAIPNAQAQDGDEWYDATEEDEILDAVKEYREGQQRKYRLTPSPLPQSAAVGHGGGRGSGNSGGRGVVVGTGTLAAVAQAESRQLRNHISRSPSPQVLARTSATGRIYQSRPPPPQTASLADKKKFAKLQGMKKRTQLGRDNKTEAEIRQGDFDEQNKWYRYYGLPQSAGTRMGA